MREKVSPEREKPQTRLRGGCVFIPVIQLTMAWSLVRNRTLTSFDLRVWLACLLEVESRKGLKDGLEPRYSVRELARRLRAGEKRVRSSLKRLGASGLVSWSESELYLARSPEELSEEPPGLWEMFNSIPNRRRLLPVPRRMLRYLATSGTTALIATVFGHLLRCLYFWPDEGFKSSGTCKASFVASVFGISLRSAKSARKELERLGWLIRGESSQWRMNSFGPDASINLDWEPPRAPAPLDPPAKKAAEPTAEKSSTASHTLGTEIAPPPAVSGPDFAPPREDKAPPSGGVKNQNPAPRGPESGFFKSNGKAKGAPNLRDVKVSDLRDTGRLLELHRQAVSEGIIGTSESERLRFVAASEHALAIGKENPCGLFIHLVRGKLWAYLTQNDEDRASARLKTHLFGGPRAAHTQAGGRPAEEKPQLSQDARTVREVLAAVSRAGYRGDAFYLLRKERPDWTRERWESSMKELEAEKRGRMGHAAEGLRAPSLAGCLPRFDGASC